MTKKFNRPQPAKTIDVPATGTNLSFGCVLQSKLVTLKCTDYIKRAAHFYPQDGINGILLLVEQFESHRFIGSRYGVYFANPTAPDNFIMLERYANLSVAARAYEDGEVKDFEAIL